MSLENSTAASRGQSAIVVHQGSLSLFVVCCWVYFALLFSVWLLLFAADRWWLATLAMFAPRWLLAIPLAVLIPAALLLRGLCLKLLLVCSLLVAGPLMGLCVPW